jgi:hypothetical protein
VYSYTGEQLLCVLYCVNVVDRRRHPFISCLMRFIYHTAGISMKHEFEKIRSASLDSLVSEGTFITVTTFREVGRETLVKALAPFFLSWFHHIRFRNSKSAGGLFGSRLCADHELRTAQMTSAPFNNVTRCHWYSNTSLIICLGPRDLHSACAGT